MNDVDRVNARLERVLRLDDSPERLAEAMRHMALGGGKRIRARLVYAAGRLADAPDTVLDQAAVAVELIHAYSLIHDDLPAMDDDDLRRGRPTVHIQFDEATAILAGDALQAMAFEVLIDDAVDADTARRWVGLLAKAAGPGGMVAGQALDIEGEGRSLSLAEVEAIHRRKTGALLHASLAMGATAGKLSEPELDAVDRFGAEIGLAFQIHDDVLDATTATEVLGKPQGSDQRQGKSTYVSALGLDAAQREAQHRFGDACGHLAIFGEKARELTELAHMIVSRTH